MVTVKIIAKGSNALNEPSDVLSLFRLEASTPCTGVARCSPWHEGVSIVLGVSIYFIKNIYFFIKSVYRSSRFVNGCKKSSPILMTSKVCGKLRCYGSGSSQDRTVTLLLWSRPNKVILRNTKNKVQELKGITQYAAVLQIYVSFRIAQTRLVLGPGVRIPTEPVVIVFFVFTHKLHIYVHEKA